MGDGNFAYVLDIQTLIREMIKEKRIKEKHKTQNKNLEAKKNNEKMSGMRSIRYKLTIIFIAFVLVISIALVIHLSKCTEYGY